MPICFCSRIYLCRVNFLLHVNVIAATETAKLDDLARSSSCRIRPMVAITNCCNRQFRAPSLLPGLWCIEFDPHPTSKSLSQLGRSAQLPVVARISPRVRKGRLDGGWVSGSALHIIFQDRRERNDSHLVKHHCHWVRKNRKLPLRWVSFSPNGGWQGRMPGQYIVYSGPCQHGDISRGKSSQARKANLKLLPNTCTDNSERPGQLGRRRTATPGLYSFIIVNEHRFVRFGGTRFNRAV